MNKDQNYYLMIELASKQLMTTIKESGYQNLKFHDITVEMVKFSENELRKKDALIDNFISDLARLNDNHKQKEMSCLSITEAFKKIAEDLTEIVSFYKSQSDYFQKEYELLKSQLNSNKNNNN